VEVVIALNALVGLQKKIFAFFFFFPNPWQATGLHEGLKLEYREDATRVCIMIADAPPHGLLTSGDGFPNGDPGDNDLIRIPWGFAKKGGCCFVGVSYFLCRDSLVYGWM